MRRSVPSLAAVLIALTVLSCASPATAFEEMSGVTMTMSPSEATSGGDMDLVVTLFNNNDRSLSISTLTVQIYNGMFLGQTDDYEMYHINPADAVVPANGSKDFRVPGNAPDYIGMCAVAVTIAGVFDGDENASFDLFSSSITLNPNAGGFIATGLLLIFAPLIIAVVAVVVVVYFFSKKGGNSTAYQPRCPRCGAVMPSGSTYCPRCGRKS